ncbi:MAG: hypothetical protein ACRDG8_11865 [Actinomycetota bacterium]
MQRHRSLPSARRAAVTGLVLALAVLAVAPAGAVVGPLQVLGGPEDQLQPATNGTYLIWTANAARSPNRYHAYGKRRGPFDRFRLNPAGTRGYAGGLDPGQDRAIYQQIDRNDSDLFWINLATRKRTRLPPTVNTDRWEWGPRVSNTFVLFARDAAGRTSLFLWDRIARTRQKLVSLDFTKYYVAPGAVGEQFATWTVCGPLTCNAYMRNTDTDQTHKIPSPTGRASYAPVVDEDDDPDQVYLVRSGQTCGSAVRILRLPRTDLSATPVSLVALPAGVDVGFQLSLEQVGSEVDLWFSRYRCGPQQGDIYRLRDVGPA